MSLRNSADHAHHRSALVLSATDLSNFLSCRHRTALEMAEAHGKRRRPKWDDPLLEILFKRGLEHEKAYVESLQAAGRRSVDLSDVKENPPRRWQNPRRDALRGRRDRPGGAGGWPLVRPAGRDAASRGAERSRRVVVRDRRHQARARDARRHDPAARPVLRDARRRAGPRPERFHVVTPDPDVPIHTYRVDDYAAYFRLVRAQMEETVAQDDEVVAAANYPEPVDHCDVCPWSSECSKKRRWTTICRSSPASPGSSAASSSRGM